MAPELRWRFFASRPRAHLGVDVVVLPFRRLWSQVRLPLRLASERPDLLFVPAHVIPFAWPGKVLAVVHDLAFERHPYAYQVADRAYLRLSTRWAVSRSRLLIAISESTKHDLVDMYGVTPERIRVVPLGISAPAVPPAPPSRLTELGLNGSFVLQVGRVEPRKNQSAAPDQLASVFDAALGDQTLRTKMARAARARAARFTWDKTAAAIAAVIRELLSS